MSRIINSAALKCPRGRGGAGLDAKLAQYMIGGQVVQPLSTNSTLVLSTNSIVIPAVTIPSGGAVWVQVHARYALAGTTGWLPNAPSTFFRDYIFRGNFTFGGQALTNPLVIEFAGTGNNVTAIGGNGTDVNGVGKGGLKVVVDNTTVGGSPASCASPNATTQNLTGACFISLSASTSSIVRLFNASCSPLGQQSFGPLAQGDFLQINFPNLSRVRGPSASSSP